MSRNSPSRRPREVSPTPSERSELADCKLLVGKLTQQLCRVIGRHGAAVENVVLDNAGLVADLQLITRKAEQELFDSQGFSKRTGHLKRLYDFMVFMLKMDPKNLEENVEAIIGRCKEMDFSAANKGLAKQMEAMKGQVRRLEKVRERLTGNVEALEKQLEELRGSLQASEEKYETLKSKTEAQKKVWETRIATWCQSDVSHGVPSLSPPFHSTTVGREEDGGRPGNFRLSFAGGNDCMIFQNSREGLAAPSFPAQLQQLHFQGKELEREAETFRDSLRRLSGLEGRLKRIRRRVLGKSERSLCLNESSMDILAPNMDSFVKGMSDIWRSQVDLIFPDPQTVANPQAKKLLLSLTFWELTCRFNFTLFEFIDSPSSDLLEEVKLITDFYDSCCGVFSRFLWDEQRALPPALRDMTLGQFLAEGRAEERGESFGEGREWSVWTRIIPLYDLWTDLNE